MPNINPKLKPLYANLKRVNIGKYLHTKEFGLYAISENFEDSWEEYKNEVSPKKEPEVSDHHDTEIEEEAFIYLADDIYENNQWDYSFHEFLLPILKHFARWNETRVDFTRILESLQEAGISREIRYDFAKEIRRVNLNKPFHKESEMIDHETSENSDDQIDKSKVFIVHGHDA